MGFLINPFLTAAPAFLPTDIAGLIRWYDADSYTGSYSDGNPITTDWLDNSVSLEDATPQAGQEPTFKDTILAAGKSSVFFTDGFKHFDTTQMLLGNYSVVVLYRPLADTIVASDPSGNYQIRDQFGGGATDKPVLYHNDGVTLDFEGTENTGIWHVRTWTRDGVSGIPFFYYNKVQEAEKDGQTSTSTMPISTVGLFNGGPGTFHLAEMLIYNAVLTQTDVDNLYDLYFTPKYPGDL